MFIYRLSQTEVRGYDTYSDCIVAAESEEAARDIRPDRWTWEEAAECYSGSWAKRRESVKVELLGTAQPGVKGMLCSSFHAG
jgi:hypothetical protein